jgi:hypothetical protein
VALSRCRGLDAFVENGAASEVPTFRPAPRAGHRLESFAWLERLEDYAVKHGLDRLLAYALLDQLRRHLLGDELIAAEEDSARLEAVAARLPDDAQAALGEIAEVAERAHRPGDRAHARPRARAGRTSKAMLGMDDARSPTRPGASAENLEYVLPPGREPLRLAAIWNWNWQPFRRTATADSILEKLRRQPR